MARRSDRVIGYVRASTEEQSLSGLGLGDQRAAISAEGIRRGWGDIQFVTDEGFSAKSLDRPGIQRALQDLTNRSASVLVVSKLDRLSRSLLDFATLMEQARRERWQLIVLDIAIDTTSPSGQLMANVMASFAQYERQLIGQRTSAALQYKKASGARLGRPRSVPSAVLDCIAEARHRGMSLAAIATDLNDRQVPTARGGIKWYASTVAAALHSLALDDAARRLAG